MAKGNNQESETLYERFIRWAKNNIFIVTILILSTIATAILEIKKSFDDAYPRHDTCKDLIFEVSKNAEEIAKITENVGNFNKLPTLVRCLNEAIALKNKLLSEKCGDETNKSKIIEIEENLMTYIDLTVDYCEKIDLKEINECNKSTLIICDIVRDFMEKNGNQNQYDMNTIDSVKLILMPKPINHEKHR